MARLNYFVAIIRWFVVTITRLVGGLALGLIKVIISLIPMLAMLGGILWYITSDDREKDTVVSVFDSFVKESLVHRKNSLDFPAVTGKVLPVDLTKGEVDKRTYFSLSEEMRPNTIEDVSMLLGINPPYS